MVSVFALLSNILLASAALAVPSPRLEANDDPAKWPPWTLAGAVLYRDGRTFDTVKGSFVVPHATPDWEICSGVFVSVAFVGRNKKCSNIKVGVVMSVDGGSVSYSAWQEPEPGKMIRFDDFAIQAGDVIEFTLLVCGPQHGGGYIKSARNTKMAIQGIRSDGSGSRPPVCDEVATWTVERFSPGSKHPPFPNFDSLTIKNATAKSNDNRDPLILTPSDSSLYNLRERGIMITSVSAVGQSLTIRRINSHL